jgi:hypothetical protein
VVASIDVSMLNADGLKHALAHVRRAQRSLDGAVLRLGAQANVLAGSGRSATAEETVRGAGMVSARQAKREAVRTEAAEAIPSLADAVSAGEISGEHIDVIARQTAKLSEEQRSRLDHDALVERAKDLPVETFESHLRRQIREVTADGGLADTVAKQAASDLRHWFDRETGMGKIFATLDPELYERITTAIDSKAASMASTAGETKDGNLSARALAELVSAGPSDRRQIPSVSVHVDYQTFTNGAHATSMCQTESGHDLSVESVRRMCCDATIRRVVFDERGVPLDVGRKVRTATDGQWAALKATYSSCAWEGCEAPIGWCQAHHIHEWEHGGATDLDNLIPLCSQHHHRVHEGRWQLKLLGDRSLKVFRPDGQLHATVPTPMRC